VRGRKMLLGPLLEIEVYGFVCIDLSPNICKVLLSHCEYLPSRDSSACGGVLVLK
ncbi:30661_t:CDS:2, partial [Racocetra persica]